MKKVIVALSLLISACGDDSPGVSNLNHNGVVTLKGGTGVESDTTFDVTTNVILQAVDRFGATTIHHFLVSSETCKRTSPDDQIDPITLHCGAPPYVETDYSFKLKNHELTQEFYGGNEDGTPNQACYSKFWDYQYDIYSTCSPDNPCIEFQVEPGVLLLHALTVRTKCTNGYDDDLL